jgi:hypothetical protein
MLQQQQKVKQATQNLVWESQGYKLQIINEICLVTLLEVNVFFFYPRPISRARSGAVLCTQRIFNTASPCVLPDAIKNFSVIYIWQRTYEAYCYGDYST